MLYTNCIIGNNTAQLLSIEVLYTSLRNTFTRLDLKEGDKVYLLTKIFESKQLSKKLDYIKIGLFKIISKIMKVLYRLDLLLKIKIHLVYYIAMLKLVYRNHKPLIYK